MFRSLKILDPILKALADEGYIFLFEEKDRYRQKEFAIEKDGEKMYINIREGYSKTSLSIKSQKT
jgi:ribosomal protein S8